MVRALQLIKSKCIPVLLYGLEACPLNKSDLHSLHFVTNSFFMKLFRTSNIETVSCCQEYFGFALSSTLWAKRVQKFDLQFSNFMYTVRSVSVRFVILHIIALYISHLLFAYSVCFKLGLLPFVVNTDV